MLIFNKFPLIVNVFIYLLTSYKKLIENYYYVYISIEKRIKIYRRKKA